MSYSKYLKNHYVVMFFAMVMAGLLSTMNVWVDKIGDIRLSLNDLYMILLMNGWMFLFMGIIDKQLNVLILGIALVIMNLWFIRNQFLITEKQYKLGMIPHHSMAIHMSKKILNKSEDDNLNSFIKNIINTQENEILFMKK